MANKRFNQITRVVSSFDSDDVLPIGNGTLGDGKMSKDTLLELTAQNALEGNVAPEFDPSKPNDEDGYAYYSGTNVTYGGKNYVFIVNHSSGAWNPDEVEQKPLSESINMEGVGEAVNAWLDEHPEATTTVQDGSLTEPKFSENLKLKTIKDYVTPEMFGAKGDGVTDDTAAIQACVSGGHKNVLFGAKHYIITDSIVLDSHTSIYGVGENSLIEIQQSIEVAKAFITLYNSNKTHIHIEGIAFYGHALAETDDESGLVAIEFQTTSDSTIRNCWFNGWHKNIELTQCENIIVDSNILYNAMEMTESKINGYGVLLESGTNIKITNNTMMDIERHCVYVNGARKVIISDNSLKAKATNKGSNYEGNIKLNGCQDVIVDNNVIEGNQYGIALLKSFSEDPDAISGKNIIIRSNIIKNCIENTGFARGMICCAQNGNYYNVVIESNIITNDTIPNYTLFGILFNNGTFDGLVIRNNEIINCPYGVRIDRNDKIVFDNNVVRSCTIGYDFNYSNLHLNGIVNYYDDCTTPLNAGVNSLRYCYMPSGCVPLGVWGTKLTSGTINAKINSQFWVAAASPVSVVDIAGGFNGQEITIFAYGAGSLTINSASITGLVKLSNVGDYSSGTYGLIKFRMIDNTWYEIGREVY